MNFTKSTIFLVLAAAAVVSTSTQAMTAKEWGRLSSQNTHAAAKVVQDAYASASAKCVAHYRQVGNRQRAEIVEKMDPNLRELVGRLHLATTSQPEADVEDVMRGYIIDSSAQLMSTSKSK